MGSKFFNIYQKIMDSQNSIPSLFNVKKLRSNSIKNTSPLLNIGFSVKLNSKKFPNDFFGRDGKHSHRVKMPASTQHIGPKTEEKNPVRHLQQISSNKMLPDAQITSFFGINYDQSKTLETAPSHDSGVQSETKIPSEFQCMLANKITTSIELSDRNQNFNDLCCTFSKIPTSISKLNTPQKKQKQEEIAQCSCSARIERPSTKTLTRKSALQKLRKNSIDKLVGNRSEQPKQASTRKYGRKDTSQFLCLPPIGKN